MLANNKEAKAAYDTILQYGGDPKTAFANYAVQMGRQNLGQQIMNMFGLNNN